MNETTKHSLIHARSFEDSLILVPCPIEDLYLRNHDLRTLHGSIIILLIAPIGKMEGNGTFCAEACENGILCDF